MTDGKVKKTKKREQKEEDDSPIASPKPKPVKQEETKQEDDGDDHPLPLFKPKKSTLGDPKEKDPKTQKKEAEKGDTQPSKAMREEPHDSEQDDGKPSKEKRKMKKKMKIVKKSLEKKTAVKGKKAYDLPGQKHDTPDERDPLRIFYETLYRQLPDSELAMIWMMEWGLLPPDEAKKVYEKKLKNRQQKLESPVKVVAVKKKSKVSVKKNDMAVKSISKTKKRKVKEWTLDDDENSSISPKKTNKKHKSST